MATEKEKLIEDLNNIYIELTDICKDESVVDMPKAIKNLNQKLETAISFLEDDVDSFKMKENE